MQLTLPTHQCIQITCTRSLNVPEKDLFITRRRKERTKERTEERGKVRQTSRKKKEASFSLVLHARLQETRYLAWHTRRGVLLAPPLDESC